MLPSKTRKCIRQTPHSLQRRSTCYQAQLLCLEDRLPPGDAVLGAVLGWSWLGTALAVECPSRLALDRDVSAGMLVIHLPRGDDCEAAPARQSTFVRADSSTGDVFPTKQPTVTSAAAGVVSVWNMSDDSWQDWDPWSAFATRRPRLAGIDPAHLDGAISGQMGRAPISTGPLDVEPTLGPVTVPAERSPLSSSIRSASPAATASELTLLGLALARMGRTGGPGPAEAPVHALFHLDVRTEAPFPTNWFTVPDRSNLTGLRVNLPDPDCNVNVSDCEDLNLINQLDGFNLQPRLSIPFDGPIDVNSVNSQSVFMINLGDTLGHHDSGGQVVGINQIVWDPPSNTLRVESDELLDQHTRYALILTNGLRSVAGTPVEASEDFRNFRHDVGGEYKHELLDAIHAARRLGIRESDIVDASVFTTESATAIMEKIRDQIHAATPEPADFNLGPDGTRTLFLRNNVSGITFHEQTMDNPPGFTDVQLDLSGLDSGAVREIAFGKYASPDYEVHPGEYIPQVGTLSGTPVVQAVNEVYFNLFLPSGPKPECGWPVAIYGHPAAGNKNNGPLAVAATMAAHGIATMSINVAGNGFGPLGTLTVNQTMVDPVTFPAGGRGIDQDGDHMIGSTEGQFATAPRTIISNRDALRQTVADLTQLVRVIEVGMDVNGDRSRDLDPSRIYYFGQSLGGVYGTMFLAVEPDVRAGVPNVPGGSLIEWSRLGPGSFRQSLGTSLEARVPPLLNSPGITSIDAVAVNAPFFNENLPLRNGIPLTVRLEDGTSHEIRSPVINLVPGAMAIQEVLDNHAWVSLSGDPLGYVSHLRKDPLPGVPAKSVLIQIAKGDQTIPNPTNTALLRAGDLADRATLYRNDLAFAEDPGVPRDPHRFMTAIGSTNELVRAIALGAQDQIATFFASDGQTIIHPEPARFFEAPIQGPLPEDLNWIL